MYCLVNFTSIALYSLLLLVKPLNHLYALYYCVKLRHKLFDVLMYYLTNFSLFALYYLHLIDLSFDSSFSCFRISTNIFDFWLIVHHCFCFATYNNFCLVQLCILSYASLPCLIFIYIFFNVLPCRL